VHHGELDEDSTLARADEIIRLDDEPDHDALCLREQEAFLHAIREDLDVNEQLDAALNSMRIVAAADESFRTGKTVEL
jgi:predicted dehydrogenase